MRMAPILLCVFCGCVSVDSSKRSERFSALSRISSEQELSDVVFQGKYLDVREAALGMIKSQNILSDVCLSTAMEPKLSVAAIQRVSDEKVLTKIVRDETRPIDVRSAAALRSRDRKIATYVVLNKSFSCPVRTNSAQFIIDANQLKVAAISLSHDSNNAKVFVACVKQLKDDQFLADDVAGAVCRVITNERVDANTRGELVEPLSKLHSPDDTLAAVVADKSMNPCDRQLALSKLRNKEMIYNIVISREMEPQYRGLALHQITGDAGLLIRTMGCADSEQIRHEALHFLAKENRVGNDYSFALLSHFRKSSDSNVLREVLESFPDNIRLDSFEDSVKLARLLGIADSLELRRLTRKFLYNQDVIDGMVRGGYGLSSDAATWAIGLIPNDIHLAKIVDSNMPNELRAAAVSRVSNQDLLKKWAADNKETKLVRILAIGLIKEDCDILETLARSPVLDVAMAATDRIHEVNPEKAEALRENIHLRLKMAIKDDEEKCRLFELNEDKYRKENESMFLKARKDIAKELELKFKEIDEKDLFRRFKYDVGGRFTFYGVVVDTERHFFSDDVIYIDVKGWGETYRVRCLIDTLPKTNSGQRIKVTGEKISDMTIKVSSVY